MIRRQSIMRLALLGAFALGGCNLVLDPDDHRADFDPDGGPAGPCGDGMIQAPETCDDGNTVSGDGCSAVCLDETDYCDPRTVGTLSDINYVHRMMVSDDHLYAVTGPSATPGQLRFADISDPTMPAYIGNRQAPTGYDGWQAKGMAIDNGYVWMVGSDPRFCSYGISTPSNPVVAWTEGPNAYGDDIAQRGDVLLVTDNVAGPVRIYRSTAMGTPNYIGSLGNPMASDIYYTVGIGVDVAYGGETQGRIDLWNVATLASPSFYATFIPPTTDGINRMVGTDSTIFAAMDGAGIRAIDISNPTVPELVDTYGDGQSFTDIFLLGDFVYAASSAGLVVVDVSDPTSMVAAATNSVPGQAGRSVTVAPPYAYISVDGPLRVVADLPGMCESACGNLRVEYPEDCDDGNHDAGDGCSPACENE